jgi:molybdopterin converting factor small subunit
MPVARLRGTLKQLAGETAEVRVDGATVAEALRALEAEQPALQGWILDERGDLRRHVNVFVGGERAEPEAAVGPDDRLEILPAISGGAA